MSVPVLAIVGYSNSGKTTLMEKLVAAFSSSGMRVATIKHSHHPVEMDRPGKDSWRHKQAGAAASLLVGPTRVMVVADLNTEQLGSDEVEGQPWGPQQWAEHYFPHYDLVLVEGYASLPGAKIEVLRAERSLELRSPVSELIAVASDVQDLTLDVPVLDLNQLEPLLEFIKHWMENQ